MALKKPMRGKPKTLDPAVASSRARGALLGLAVGDAFGVTFKGRPMHQPQFPQLAQHPHSEMTGGGPLAVKPGQVTEPTQMAAALARSLREIKGFDVTDVTKRYYEWRAHAFSVPPHIQHVFAARDEGGIPAQNPPRYAWLQSYRRIASSGALMRAAPLAVFLSKDRDALIRASMDDCAITHYDPRCRLSNVAFTAALAHALQSVERPEPLEMVEAAITALSLAGAQLGKELENIVYLVTEAMDFVRQDLAAAQQADPMLYGPDLHMHLQADSVRVSLRYAFWLLFHAPSLEAALLDTSNRGGEANINGAVVGALLGAVYGEEAVPPLWKAPVLAALSTGLPGRPLFDLYHPRMLLTLADLS